MLKKSVRLAAVTMLFMLSSCCSVPHHQVARPYDASNPLKRVVVLPMKNDTNDVDAPDLVRKKMVQALEDKSYIVVNVKESDQILRDQMGINLGGQLEMTTPQKLGEVLGVEGVLYGTLIDFDETTTGILNVRKVRAKFRLVQTQSGQAFWERGLGVRSETRMSGSTGGLASLVARGADSKDKETPWVTIESKATNERNIGQAFAMGLGAKLFAKAVGVHLERETKELVRRVTDTLPWGPGSSAVVPAPGTGSTMAIPNLKMPAPPSFGHMDYGKRDFSAVLDSVSVNKNSNETVHFEIPLARKGANVRMDMDLAGMAKGADGVPPVLSMMSTIHHGNKKLSYLLYPNAKKYMIQSDREEDAAHEKPAIEKTKVGSEVLDGHPTDKYKVKMTYKSGSSDEGFIWSARDLDGMTIKSEVENGETRVTTRLKNISFKTPAASLFKVPAGYAEAKSVMELMTDQK
jgi:hypothetical protein